MRDRFLSGRLRRPGGVAAAALLCLTTVSGCGEDYDHNPPGANARIGSILIRYAHIGEPPNGPWEEGDSAPLHMWLYNQGDEPDALIGAETTVADDVSFAHFDEERDRVPLEPGERVELREDRHLLLVDLDQVIRGGDYVWVTLNFERAGSLALQLHSQVPAYVDQDPAYAPGLTDPPS